VAINPTTYRYTIAQKTFDGKVLAPDHVFEAMDEELAGLAEALAERYRTKQPFTVFVNPDSPSQAMLTRDLDIGPAIGLSAVGLFLCLVGVLFGVGAATLEKPVPPAPGKATGKKPKRDRKQAA
jgi:hypothetical protein